MILVETSVCCYPEAMINTIIFDWGRTLYNNETGDLFPETIEVLGYCTDKYELGMVSLVSDGKIKARMEKVNSFNLNKYFSFSLFDTENKDKLFQEALIKLNLKPEEIMVVDDRIKRMSWPIQNGLKTCWLKRGKFANEVPDIETGEPTFIITNLKEVLNHI